MSNLSFTDNVQAACMALGFRSEEFTSAEVRSFLEHNGVRPAHCNGWGAAFAACQSRGTIMRVDTATSKRASRNHGRVIVWTLTVPAWHYVCAMVLDHAPSQADYILA